MFLWPNFPCCSGLHNVVKMSIAFSAFLFFSAFARVSVSLFIDRISSRIFLSTPTDFYMSRAGNRTLIVTE
ncbi:hypothetical protein M5D96_006873 [Drosophila gunungcola]|uniref:Uncharacterized protein n=1 Tax=Drosophila gunungcola TaxID=103775 RepID=A0A9P9YPS2_9MUSC|nr:hypothetical protein M5D96_006873 [Drosophila gunungcola]